MLMHSGHPVTSEFKVIDGKTYYFNAEGKKLAVEIIIGGKRYFFDKNGVLPLEWSEDKQLITMNLVLS